MLVALPGGLGRADRDGAPRGAGGVLRARVGGACAPLGATVVLSAGVGGAGAALGATVVPAGRMNGGEKG